MANLGGPSYGLCCSMLSVCISVVWQSVLTSEPSECKSQSAPRCWHLHSSSVLFVCCRVRSRFPTAGTPAGLWHQLKSTSTTLLRPLTLDDCRKHSMLLTCLCGRTSRVTKVGDHDALYLGPVKFCPETMRNAVTCGQSQSCIRRKPSE